MQGSRGRFFSRVRQRVVPLHCLGGTAGTCFLVTLVDQTSLPNTFLLLIGGGGFQIMYGVLYAVSAEIFPANHRGTGNGLTGATNHVFGVLVRPFLCSCTY